MRRIENGTRIKFPHRIKVPLCCQHIGEIKRQNQNCQSDDVLQEAFAQKVPMKICKEYEVNKFE